MTESEYVIGRNKNLGGQLPLPQTQKGNKQTQNDSMKKQ